MTILLSPPPLVPAALLESPAQPAAQLRQVFAEELRRRGWRIGPMDGGAPDLMVVDVFAEPGGEDALRLALSEGVPLLTTVAAENAAAWDRLTGGHGVVLPPSQAALWRWWGPHRLYGDLARGVAEVTAKRVVIGLNWVLVEGPHGIGMAATPRPPGGCRALGSAGRLAGSSLRELASWSTSLDPLEAALGMAAINANYNRFDLAGEAVNGLDELKAVAGPAVAVGRFPGLADRRPDIQVVERHPAAGEFPEQAASWLLPKAAVAVLTSSALANHTLAGLLGQATAARRVLVGPSTPLAERLFVYGLDALAGTVVTEPDGAARVVAEGGAVKALKPFTRSVTLRRSA